MVRYSILLNVMEDYTQKCTDYPKYQALKYFKEHREEFQEETWDDDGWSPSSVDDSPPGKLFMKQENLQQDIEYTNEEMAMLRRYGGDYFRILQYFNNLQTKNYNELSEEIQNNLDEEFYTLLSDDLRIKDGGSYYNLDDWEINAVRNMFSDEKNWMSLQDFSDGISKMINKSPRLQQDTVLYRYGRLPTDAHGNPVKEGRTGTYKGQIGISYNSNLVHNDRAFLKGAGWQNEDNRYKITYYAMKGTKGVVLGESVRCNSWQNEFLLDKNQRCAVVEVNEDTKEAICVLY